MLEKQTIDEVMANVASRHSSMQGAVTKKVGEQWSAWLKWKSSGEMETVCA